MKTKIDTNTEHQTLIIGSHKFNYELRFTNRKMLSISVHPNLDVIVEAPFDTSIKDIEEKIIKRISWITKQKRYFSEFLPLPLEKKYVSGETHRYLGKQYRLKVIQSEDEKVKLVGRYINIYTRNKSNSKQIKKLLENWYNFHAKRYIQKRFEENWKIFSKNKIPSPKLELRKMKRRWGSCTNNSHIILNIELIKTSSLCIDYVIYHELCHLRHRNHNKDFYILLTRYLPDWEKRKDKLEKQFLI